MKLMCVTLSICKLRESEVLFRCRYVLIIEFFDFVEIPANFESVRIYLNFGSFRRSEKMIEQYKSNLEANDRKRF